MNNRLFLVTPVMMFGLIVVGLGLGLTNDPRAIPSALIDRPMPAFTRPAVLSGRPDFSSAHLKGKVALVNMFASWCRGCRVEHPLLMNIAGAGEFPIYGVNWKDRPGAGAAFLRKHGDPYRRSGNDPTGRLGIDLGVTGLPETFVIDRSGRIRYRHIGPVTPKVWKNVLRPLLVTLELRQ